ncbi:MAG: hypothetical protein H6713_27280 [Myxococcales bacterium]|nr:hypothetical protein [Myxococcales bacterium]
MPSRNFSTRAARGVVTLALLAAACTIRPGARGEARRGDASPGWRTGDAAVDASPRLTAISSELAYRELARARRDGALVETTLRVELTNTNSARSVVGELLLELPAGAQVSSLALGTDAGSRDALVVPRALAERVFETIVGERRDPALLRRESLAGERGAPRFSLRVFPLFIGEPRSLELAFIHLDERASLDVAAHQGSRAVIRAVARPSDVETIPSPLIVLVDSSASMGPTWTRTIDALEAALLRLRARRRAPLELELAAFDHARVTLYRGPLSELSEAPLESLRRHGPLGSSELRAALAGLRGRAAGRLVVVSDDGRVSDDDAGAAEREAPARALESALAGVGAPRVDIWRAEHDEGERDGVSGALRAAALAGSPERGALVPLTWPTERLVDSAGGSVDARVELDVSGSRLTWPNRQDELHAGELVTVFAEFADERTAAGPHRLVVTPVPPDSTPGATSSAEPDASARRVLRVRSHPSQGPLFSRYWSAGVLDAELAAARERGELDVLTRLRARSVQAGALNELTAMLVLETEEDERRFELEGYRSRSPLAPVVEPEALAETRALEHRARELMERERWAEQLERAVLLDLERQAQDPSRSLAERRAALLSAIASETHAEESARLRELVLAMTDERVDPSARACHTGRLSAIARARARRPPLAEGSAPPEPLDPSGRWPTSPDEAAELSAAWSARGRPDQAVRSVMSMLEFEDAPLELAAALELLPGREAEARGRLRDRQRALELELAALPEVARPLSGAWRRALLEGVMPPARGIALHAERLELAGLLARGWLRQGQRERALAELDRVLVEPVRAGHPLLTDEDRLDARALEELADALRRAGRSEPGSFPEVLIIAHVPATRPVELMGVDRSRFVTSTSARVHGSTGLLALRRPLPVALLIAPRRASTWARVDIIELAPALRVTSHVVRARSSAPTLLPLPRSIRARSGCPGDG